MAARQHSVRVRTRRSAIVARPVLSNSDRHVTNRANAKRNRDQYRLDDQRVSNLMCALVWTLGCLDVKLSPLASSICSSVGSRRTMRARRALCRELDASFICPDMRLDLSGSDLLKERALGLLSDEDEDGELSSPGSLSS